MIPQIQTALNAVLGSAATLRNANGAGRAFELFVMSGIARELQVRGYDVWLQRSDGSPIRPHDSDRQFFQRGGAPTGVSGAAQGTNNASVIGFRWAHRQAWEIWNGIQFEGRSGARHEIDLAVVPETVGRALRARANGGVPLGRPRIAIECKHVTMSGGSDEMRAFIARLYDLTLLHAHRFYLHYPGLPHPLPPRAIHPGAPAGSIHRPTITYRCENQRTLNIIARKSGFSSGSATMTSYYSVEPHARIVAGSPNAVALIRDVADWIIARGY